MVEAPMWWHVSLPTPTLAGEKSYRYRVAHGWLGGRSYPGTNGRDIGPVSHFAPGVIVSHR